MKAIVSVTRDWGIGYCGRLAVSHSGDMRRFRELTMGDTVIMGFGTFMSLPNGPLSRRTNVVLTSVPRGLPWNVTQVHNMDELFDLIRRKEPRSECWVIGGETVYRQLLPYCTDAYVTFNDVSTPVDRWFPNLDKDPRWELMPVNNLGATFDDRGLLYPYEYRHYVRNEKIHGLEEIQKAQEEGQVSD